MLKIYDQDAGHPAVLCGNKEYTYGQLISDTQQLCSAFLCGNIRKVAIIAPQSYRAYCAIWATYLAGGTFCCINADYPEQRKLECLRLFEPDLVLCDTEIPLWDGGPVRGLDDYDEEAPAEPAHNCFVAPNEIAYVLFTSGSTGVPKGVRIRRDALEQVIQTAQETFALSPQDVGGQYSNISFDMGICDVFAMISSGVKMVTVAGIGKLLPAVFIERQKITFWYSVPNVLDLMEKRGDLTAKRLGSLRCIGFGGATLFQRHVEKLFQCNPTLTVVNTYGPTEITIFSSAVPMQVHNYLNYCDGSACLGKDIAHVQQKLRLCDDGLYEVVVYGEHVMDGYLVPGRSDCTLRQTDLAEFATGDLVRVKDGQLYFVCRNDSQVKIQGNRVDLSEIDSALRRLGVENEVVLAVDGVLVAFIERGKIPVADNLREQMANDLPAYCIPSLVIQLDTMRYNSNGKYDRKALTEIARQLLAKKADE